MYYMLWLWVLRFGINFQTANASLADSKTEHNIIEQQNLWLINILNWKAVRKQRHSMFD